jgi:hypothetical protein
MANAEQIVLHRLHFPGETRPVDFVVPRAELEKVPPWEPADGEPVPTTRDQALEAARNAALREGLDVADESDLIVTLRKTNPFERNLLRRLPPRCCGWFYEVDFQGNKARLKANFTFLVTMSGAVATKDSGGTP